MTTSNLPPKETQKPATAAEAADCVRRAFEDGTPVRLSLEKMNRLIDFPAEDMTVTVEAGMTVAELQHTLAQKRQWLPVDVPTPETTTVGQAIDQNAAGPRRFGHGAMRDYLLGFAAIDGRGVIFYGGGRVVKNAAGYNMTRLLAGSRGALAVITQATLMTRPLPETFGLLACEVRDFEKVEELLAALTRSPSQPISMELEAGGFADAAQENPVCGPIDRKNAARLCLGFEGSASEVAWAVERTLKDWKSLGLSQPVVMPRLPDGRYWRWAADFAADRTFFTLPSDVVSTVKAMRGESPACIVHASAGDGVIRVKGFGNWGLEISEERLAAASTRRDLSDEGCFAAATLPIARAIKERFDPKNILTPLGDEQRCE